MDLSSVELKMLQEELLLLLLFRNSLSQGCSYDHGTKKSMVLFSQVNVTFRLSL